MADTEGHKYEFEVVMSCSGCSGAVDRVLKRLDGVKDYEVSLENKTAVVDAEPSLSYDTVLQTISKTGKKVLKSRIDGGEWHDVPAPVPAAA